MPASLTGLTFERHGSLSAAWTAATSENDVKELYMARINKSAPSRQEWDCDASETNTTKGCKSSCASLLCPSAGNSLEKEYGGQDSGSQGHAARSDDDEDDFEAPFDLVKNGPHQ